MKNHDLIWVREHKGLTQTEAAAICHVARGTYNAWENGRMAMPKRKFYRFLEDTHTNPKDIPPPPIEYDEKGYPVGWGTNKFSTYEDEEAALEALEGSQYDARERTRFELLQYRILGRTPASEPLVRQMMVEYDEAHSLA